MRTLRRLTSAGVVWLATASMLFAGVPHAACRCPDGHVKPLCLNLPLGDAGCCCGGGSCCAPAARPAGRSCCGGAAGDKHGGSPSADGTLSTACCVKTAAQPTTPALPPTNADRADDGTTALILLSAAPVQPLPGTAGLLSREGTHSLAPPDDIVIRLQHLLI